MVAMAENVHEAAQVEAICLREELESTGCFLHFSHLAGFGLTMLAMPSLNAPGFCQCRVKGGGPLLDGAASQS